MKNSLGNFNLPLRLRLPGVRFLGKLQPSCLKGPRDSLYPSVKWDHPTHFGVVRSQLHHSHVIHTRTGHMFCSI